jgi:glycosyltransferase involved in cell wall biosynthesis
MHELVRQGENGLIVKENNPEQLASLLLAFTRNPLRPDKHTLHQNTAEQYGVEKIGSMFNDLYTSLYTNKS